MLRFQIPPEAELVSDEREPKVEDLGGSKTSSPPRVPAQHNPPQIILVYQCSHNNILLSVREEYSGQTQITGEAKANCQTLLPFRAPCSPLVILSG